MEYGREKLKFEPPKPTLKQGILDLFDLFATQFKTTTFQEGVVRSFINTGTIPQDSTATTPKFKEYKLESVNGSVSFIPLGTHSAAEAQAVLKQYSEDEICAIINELTDENDPRDPGFDNQTLDYDNEIDQDFVDNILDDIKPIEM